MENAEENLDDLVDYVERICVHRRHGRGRRRSEAPRFLPETRNVHTSVLSNRTNNALEIWHTTFQKLVVVHHPSFGDLLKC